MQDTGSNRHTAPTPKSCCPYCDNALDAASHMTETDVTPSPGDVTICLYCAQALIFDAALLVRKPAPGELEAAYAACPGLAGEIALHQRAVRAVDRSDIPKRG